MQASRGWPGWIGRRERRGGIGVYLGWLVLLIGLDLDRTSRERVRAPVDRSIDRRLIGYGAVVRRGASDGESTWGVCSRSALDDLASC